MMNASQAQASAELGEMWPLDLYETKAIAHAAYATAARTRQAAVEPRTIFGQPNPLLSYYDRLIAGYARTVEEIEAEEKASQNRGQFYGE